MTYRLAKSLEVLRAQINQQSPNRSKESDGWIGNAEHQSRDSDHNPWVVIDSGPEKGTRIVTAIDLTHDRKHGVDCESIAYQIMKSEDPRVKYLIWNKRIMAGNEGPKPWVWRAYGGTNPHNKHLHVSVEDSDGDPEGLFDRTHKWVVDLDIPEDVKEKPPAQPRYPTLKRGARGEDVKVLQGMLNGSGYKLKVDGEFGPATDKAVRHFQKSQGIATDGIVGPYTWERLES